MEKKHTVPTVGPNHDVQEEQHYGVGGNLGGDSAPSSAKVNVVDRSPISARSKMIRLGGVILFSNSMSRLCWLKSIDIRSGVSFPGEAIVLPYEASSLH
jgi:hypothetical protein